MTARRFCFACLTLASVAFALRAGQLALRETPSMGWLGSERSAAPSELGGETTGSHELGASASASDSSHPDSPLTTHHSPSTLQDLHAELAGVCPTIANMSAEAFVAEAERGRGTGDRGQETAQPWDADWYDGGIRPAGWLGSQRSEAPSERSGETNGLLALGARASASHPSHPVAGSKQWLVPPEQWFLPGEGKRETKPVAPPIESKPVEPPSAPSPVEPPSTELPQEPPSEVIPPEPPSVALPVAPPSEELPAREEKIQHGGDRGSPAIENRAQPEPVFAPPSTPLMPHGREPGTSPSPSPSPADGGEGSLVDPHLALFAKNCYPSARECGECHKQIYEEWAVSSHAYAHVSPMYQKFEQKINDISKGTVGYFCMRCHAPVAVAMCQSRDKPIWDMPEVAREGITCIACHRVQYRYGKTNGERRIEPGDIYAPVFGGIGGEGIAKVIAEKDHFKVKTSPDEKGPGQPMHVAGIYFDQLSKAEFCQSCHQVAVHPGIKLEVVWEQYRKSPACKKGISCQDCHMGRIPGIPSGYEVGPIAEISGKTVNDHRKHANHIFYGPGYSIAHPGIFPFNKDASRWTIPEWLQFDWRAGWGTDAFEDAVADGRIRVSFPPVWAEADDRYDAREVINANQKRLAVKTGIRREIMENGTHVEGPFFKHEPCAGQDLKFDYVITNKNEGHNVLTASLGAQPQLWANVVLIGPDGQRLWETGYTDAYGDLCGIHSEQVRHHQVPYDWQLFNLQTMFLITGAVGTDREFYLPVNVDIDQLPFLRPGTLPISVLNHPPFIRMESRSLAPLGSRRAKYKVPGHLVQQPGRYRLTFRLRNRTEPIYFMRFCEATVEMQRAMNEGILDVHPYSVEFIVR